MTRLYTWGRCNWWFPREGVPSGILNLCYIVLSEEDLSFMVKGRAAYLTARNLQVLLDRPVYFRDGTLLGTTNWLLEAPQARRGEMIQKGGRKPGRIPEKAIVERLS